MGCHTIERSYYIFASGERECGDPVEVVARAALKGKAATEIFSHDLDYTDEI